MVVFKRSGHSFPSPAALKQEADWEKAEVFLTAPQKSREQPAAAAAAVGFSNSEERDHCAKIIKTIWSS